MYEDVDSFVKNLQEKIFEDTKNAFGFAAYKRWQKPLYQGEINNPDGYARVTGPCNDTMEIFLNFENDRVKKASFKTDGCGSSMVCGSFAAEMALNKTPDELLFVTGKDILEKLGGLPGEEQHCAFLAGETLQEALNDYMIKQQRR